MPAAPIPPGRAPAAVGVRNLKADRQVDRQLRQDPDEVDTALARQQPRVSRGMDQAFGRRRDLAGRVAKLRIAQHRARDRRDILQRGGGAPGMQRIDQDAAVRTACVADDTQGRLRVRHLGPRHELQIGGQTVFRRGVAKCRKRRRQPRLVGIVTGHQDGAGAKRAARFEKRRERIDLEIRSQPHDLDIEYGGAAVLCCAPSFRAASQHRSPADETRRRARPVQSARPCTGSRAFLPGPARRRARGERW